MARESRRRRRGNAAGTTGQAQQTCDEVVETKPPHAPPIVEVPQSADVTPPPTPAVSIANQELERQKQIAVATEEFLLRAVRSGAKFTAHEIAIFRSRGWDDREIDLQLNRLMRVIEALRVCPGSAELARREKVLEEATQRRVERWPIIEARLAELHQEIAELDTAVVNASKAMADGQRSQKIVIAGAPPDVVRDAELKVDQINRETADVNYIKSEVKWRRGLTELAVPDGGFISKDHAHKIRRARADHVSARQAAGDLLLPSIQNGIVESDNYWDGYVNSRLREAAELEETLHRKQADRDARIAEACLPLEAYWRNPL